MTQQPDHDSQSDRETYRRFERAWQTGSRLTIEECLPDEDHPQYLQILEELVHIDLEYSWKELSRRCVTDQSEQDSPVPQSPRVENYVARFQRLDQPDVLSRLLRQEYFVRHMCGDQPGDEEFRERFPEIQFSIDETKCDLAFSETEIHSLESSSSSTAPTLSLYPVSRSWTQRGLMVRDG